MRPGTYDLNLYRGDSYHWQFVCFTSTGNADLTGVTAKAEIRSAPGGAVLATPTCTVTQPNKIDMVLNTPMWTNLKGNGVWDLQLTYSTTTPASVVTIIRGAVVVTPDVTDSAAAVFARGVARVATTAAATD